ncbi:Disease resistance response protein [Parasponia andersonii]|uniref:Dirigent protein n=1 Tax=Parasponia andersonii TaxID=3476 RepID=A0A2P5DM69_PARAD|nr:Disease resistance response protein [Parasponia andersonii]
MSHLHFYFHDILSGKNPTAVKIINEPPDSKSSSGLFGRTYIMDDALTEGQEPTSKIVGRAQGFYSLAAQNDVALLMVLNFVFIEGVASVFLGGIQFSTT